jgi:hypothetical protein
MVPEVALDDETFFEAVLWCSAICHSTKGALSGFFAGNFFKGWDYLLRSFLNYACHSGKPTVDTISSLDASRLRDLLLLGVEQGSVRFNDLERRAEILRSTAAELSHAFGGCVYNVLAAGRDEQSGTAGYYSSLGRLTAFNDELRKKSTAFLMTVYYSGRWDFGSQLDDIEPMVDYHRMRLLLRTGCIVTTVEIADTLRTQSDVSTGTEQAIRHAAREICLAVPGLVSWHMFDFDVALWTHARSCCRKSPLCVSRRVENESFSRFVDVTAPEFCVFEQWCPGACSNSLRSLWEPKVHTEHY